MKTIYLYISFIRIPTTGKTLQFSCVNNKSGAELGVVKWHGSWRQYCYFPSVQAVYSAGCLDDISDFIYNLMMERKNDSDNT